MSDPLAHTLVIGVDGGATGARALAVLVREGRLEPTPHHATFLHELVPGFAPRPVTAQVEACRRNAPEIDELESEQGRRWLETYALAIESVVARAWTGAACARSPVPAEVEVERVLVGICAPGQKSAGGRGLVVVKNGPRIPAFLDCLESRLAQSGIVLARPIAPLVSDGLAAGLGEQSTEGGGFTAVRAAYYVGGGTGIAECFVLDGRVVSLDELSDACAKAWSTPSSLGRDYEAHLSARGLNARHVELGGDAHSLPEQAARRGDRAAEQAFEECAAMLAELVNRRTLEIERARGVTLERVVVGARLGAWFADDALRSVLREPTQRATRIPIHASTLQAAAAIGAARWALEHHERGPWRGT